MKHFLDTATDHVYAFEDDVTVTMTDGVSLAHVIGENGDLVYLSVPQTLVAHTLPAVDLVLDAQIKKLVELTNRYALEIQRPIRYLGTEFQADLDSQSTLNKVLTGCGGTLPVGFYWVDIANVKVDVTLENLQVMSSLMLAQGWNAFQNFQDKKTTIKNAATVQAVNEVTW